MAKDRLSSDRRFLLALAIIIAIIVISIGTYQRWWSLRILVEPFYLGHWLGIIGAGWIAVFTPIYVYLKRKSPRRFQTVTKIHVFGNLGAFLLISMHFWQQLGRPADFAPDLGTGLSLYIVITAMVVSGLILRFKLVRSSPQTWRAIHVGLSVSFYIVLIIHVLRNIGVL